MLLSYGLYVLINISKCSETVKRNYFRIIPFLPDPFITIMNLYPPFKQKPSFKSMREFDMIFIYKLVSRTIYTLLRLGFMLLKENSIVILHSNLYAHRKIIILCVNASM